MGTSGRGMELATCWIPLITLVHGNMLFLGPIVGYKHNDIWSLFSRKVMVSGLRWRHKYSIQLVLFVSYSFWPFLVVSFLIQWGRGEDRTWIHIIIAHLHGVSNWKQVCVVWNFMCCSYTLNLSLRKVSEISYIKYSIYKHLLPSDGKFVEGCDVVC